MSEQRVRLQDEVPDSVRAEAEKYFPLIDRLAPQWCSRVWVRWKAVCVNDEECKACAVVMYEYRYAVITLHAKWLDYPEDDRRETIVHETIHIYIQPLSGYAHHLIVELVGEDNVTLTAITKEHCREYQESVVQDLALMVLRLE